ncbi:MAG: flagellar protein FlgN [Oscillospiraceae bacterium]|nr:flagellar protein FlgN [Oscillospiraceae bacterium]
MASLTEELISVLRKEQEIYQQLIPITEEKTKVIVQNNLKALQEITEREQQAVEQLNTLERKREEIIVNMGTVLNRDPRTLKLKNMVKLMEKRPEEQKQLAELYDTLTVSIKRLSEINERNKVLINQSLEMIQFEMNLIQSTRMAPGSNNYNKQASSLDVSAASAGMFDAKQ